MTHGATESPRIDAHTDTRPMSTRDTERLTRTLTELPTLHAELVAIGETPAISQESETRRPIPGSRPPVNLNRLTLLSGSESALSILTAWTRHTASEARTNDIDLPDMAEHATIASECTWLLAIRWHLIHQPWAASMVQDLATLHGRIRSALNYRTETRYICPECGDTMRLQSGDQWFQCDSGHQIEATTTPPIRWEQPATTARICERFGITEDRLKQWRKRGHIEPATAGKGRWGQASWWPWDVYLILNPAIAAAIEQVETRREAG